LMNYHEYGKYSKSNDICNLCLPSASIISG
jgi:hypothetical protein